MIIHSTTLDTEAKVKAIYGSNTSWIQHSDYFLRGAISGVSANNNTFNINNGFGGEDSHTLTVNEMPSHKHTVGSGLQDLATNWGCVQASGSKTNAGSYTHTETGAKGGGAAHNNIPKYKSVYIWERIA